MKKIIANFCLIVAFSSLYQATTFAESQKTQVVIIGGIHSFHHKNPKYSPEILKEIILSLKPDAILNELPLSLVDPNGRPIIRSRNANEPETWAADQVAQELGIKQIPFDRPDRQEHYRKTKKFQRGKKAEKRFSEWLEQVIIKAPESVDLKITQLSTYCLQAQIYLSNNFGPEIINSDGYDEIVRIKHILWEEIRPEILKKYPGYEILVEDYDFDYQEWQERNRIMADNIIKAAKQYPGKRLVVVTGADHRYILRDLLKDEPGIDLKEYWEVTDSDIKEPRKSESSQQKKESRERRMNALRRTLRWDRDQEVAPFEILMDDPNDAHMARLRTDYRLEELVAGAADGYERLQIVLKWAHDLWDHSGDNKPSKSDPITILEEASQGQRFRCVEYSIVVAAASRALGMPSRVLALKRPDVETAESGAGHVVAEVWLDQFDKWVLVDGQMDAIPERKGIPLNAVEFQDALAQNAQDLRVKSYSGTDVESYVLFVGPYLFFFDFNLDQRFFGEDYEKRRYGPIKGKIMLVPKGAKNPTVFQKRMPIKNCTYISNPDAFYPNLARDEQ